MNVNPISGAELLALMARLADRAHACGLSGLRFELGDKAEAARIAELHRRGFREAGLYSHGIPVDVTSFEPWQVELKGALSGQAFPAELDSKWTQAAAHALDVLEESAARNVGERSPLGVYSTLQGVLVCKAMRAPFRFEYTLASALIDRHGAQVAIAQTMQARLS